MIDHFSLLAPLYDRLIRPTDSPVLMDLIKPPEGGWLLDAGGGTGRATHSLVETVENIIICDISRPMLNQAQRKNGLRSVQSSVTKLPFPDNSFERVVVVDALHHFKQPENAVCELFRILKPGGRLVIEEFDISTLFVKALALMEKLLLMDSRFFHPHEIKAMATFSNAASRIVRNGKHVAWIVIEKIPPKE